MGEIISFAITKGNISDQNMKSKPISEANKFLLKKRGIIETVFGQLKDFRHLVHTKYRSKINYLTNVLSALLAYMLNPNKPIPN